MPTLEEITVPPPPMSPADWNADGVVIINKFIPEQLMVDYENKWLEVNGPTGANRPMGWPDPIPYMRYPELRNLLTYGPLAELLETLISEPAGLHLNLTGWQSTQRDWHQDSYLNPPHVGDYYAAVWIALDEIHPDSGPFQYVPGSHRWRQVTQELIMQQLDENERDHRWPKFSERILTPLFEEEIIKQGNNIVSYLPSRGDVLIWHGRLMHRGSPPNVHGMERRALIAHYSGIKHRADMPRAKKTDSGGWYFPLTTDLEMYYGK
jgi:hypothetical protein